MHRKLPKGTLQNTNMEPFKEDTEQKDLPPCHHAQQGSVYRWGRRYKGSGRWGWGGCVCLGAGDHAHSVKCTFGECTFDKMHRSDSEHRGGGGGRGEGLPCMSRLSPRRPVCLGKPSEGSSLTAEELAPGKGFAANNSKWWRRGGSLWCCSPL